MYQATGASPVTVNNISSTVAFNVITLTITTSYKLISVTDESTNASTDFSGTSASITVPLRIGVSFEGGIIAYILQPGDPGYDVNTPHGLIAATSDQSTGIRWYNGSDITTGATATAIGTGLANTTTIISIQGNGSYAAKLCEDYSLTLDGVAYTDWYLPSNDELSLMYTNIGKGAGASSPNYNIGGFANNNYWSSTEIAYNYAWPQYFFNGYQNFNYKSDSNYVRAIRAF